MRIHGDLLDVAGRGVVPRLSVAGAWRWSETVWGFVTQVAAPTLVLWGDNDAFLGGDLMRGMERFCDAVEVHRLEGCSHWIQQDRPEEVVRLMRGLISK